MQRMLKMPLHEILHIPPSPYPFDSENRHIKSFNFLQCFSTIISCFPRAMTCEIFISSLTYTGCIKQMIYE